MSVRGKSDSSLNPDITHYIASITRAAQCEWRFCRINESNGWRDISRQLPLYRLLDGTSGSWGHLKRCPTLLTFGKKDRFGVETVSAVAPGSCSRLIGVECNAVFCICMWWDAFQLNVVVKSGCLGQYSFPLSSACPVVGLYWEHTLDGKWWHQLHAHTHTHIHKYKHFCVAPHQHVFRWWKETREPGRRVENMWNVSETVTLDARLSTVCTFIFALELQN